MSKLKPTVTAKKNLKSFFTNTFLDSKYVSHFVKFSMGKFLLYSIEA